MSRAAVPPPAAGPAWLPALFAGDRAALSRAITAVENETADAGAVLDAIQSRLGSALVVGFTGAPGAGKSTLVGAYVAELRRRGLTVGVVAVDPSSPVSGGALLGDRIRMTAHSGDAGVFVRSLASRGHLGGLSRTAGRVVDVMDAAGKDVVVVETVGAGQSEVEIAEIADLKVVVQAPGLGDEVQAIKAGILEIADILVVNKADQPLAHRTYRQLRAMARQTGREPPVPVLKTSATGGDGLAALADAIAGLADQRRRGAGQRGTPERLRRLLATLVGERARLAIEHTADPRLGHLLGRLARGDLTFDAAADAALRLLGGKQMPEESE